MDSLWARDRRTSARAKKTYTDDVAFCRANLSMPDKHGRTGTTMIHSWPHSILWRLYSARYTPFGPLYPSTLCSRNISFQLCRLIVSTPLTLPLDYGAGCLQRSTSTWACRRWMWSSRTPSSSSRATWADRTISMCMCGIGVSWVTHALQLWTLITTWRRSSGPTGSIYLMIQSSPSERSSSHEIRAHETGG